jgi:hypothetical protein
MTDEQRDTLIAWLTRQIEAASIDYDDCIKRGLSHSAERLWGRWVALHEVKQRLGEAPPSC